MAEYVYICSPFSGDTETNIEHAKQYCAYALAQGKIPMAPHLYFPQFLRDTVQEERRIGMEEGIKWLAACDEIWVFGFRLSEGMKAEVCYAVKHHIPLRHYVTFWGTVVPGDGRIFDM